MVKVIDLNSHPFSWVQISLKSSKKILAENKDLRLIKVNNLSFIRKYERVA